MMQSHEFLFRDLGQKGEIIESYENDKPYPSFLILYTIEKRPIHVVFAYDDNENIVVITTYIPHNTKWENDFSCTIINIKIFYTII